MAFWIQGVSSAPIPHKFFVSAPILACQGTPDSFRRRGYKHRACLRTVRLPASCGLPGEYRSASPVWRRSWLNILRRTYPLFSGRYPCRILCLVDFCPFHELLFVEPETRVHHDTLLYHNFAYFSISFGVFGAHRIQIISLWLRNSSNLLRLTNFLVPT